MTALAQFAERKLLPIEYLSRRHVSDDPSGGIGFDYGADARSRIRKSPETAHPTYWSSGDKRPMRALGYQFASKFSDLADKSLLIVEGESDTLTLWFHGRPALGIPGSTMTHVLTRDDAIWAQRVFAFREPGDAGRKFVELVAKRLRDIGFTGEIFEISLDDHKDVSALHIAVGGDKALFAAAIDASIAEAKPVPTSGPIPASSPLGVLNDDNLVALATEHVDWLMEGLLRESGIMVLSAQPKVGKSELARNLAKAVATGGEFLGRRCRKGKVVWVGLEEPLAHLQDRIEVHKLLGLGIQWVVQKPAGDEAVWLRRVVEQHRPDLVVIDTIGRFLTIDNIKDYSDVLRATQIMLDLRNEYGVAFCAIHHNNKATDTTLGSTMWEAFCDSIVLLTRSPDGERFVRTIQRSGSSMESVRLEHDEDTGSITIAEPKRMADQRAAEQRMLKYAASLGRPATREELASHSGRRASIGRAAVDGLVIAGLLTATGSGTRADPRLYAPAPIPPDEHFKQQIRFLVPPYILSRDEESEESDALGKPVEESPTLSEESEESGDSEESGADLLAYASEVLGGA